MYTLFRTARPKTIPCPAARLHIAQIREYPPGGRQGKLRNLRAKSGLVPVMTYWFVFFVVRCIILLLAIVKTCQSKLVNSFTSANKTCQGKTRQRKLVVHTREHVNIVNDTCQIKKNCSCVTGFTRESFENYDFYIFLIKCGIVMRS